MRKIYLLILILLVSVGAYSQTYVDTHDPKSKEVKSLLGKGNQLDGFGGVDLKLSKIKEDRTLLAGMYGGAIINRNFLLGIGAYSIVSDNDYHGLYDELTEKKKLSLNGGYGGVIFGATILTREVIHLSIPIFFGGGSMDVDDNRFDDNKGSGVTVEQSAFFVVEPAAQIEINVTKNFRIAGGMTYRYISASGFKEITDNQLSGWSTVLSFRFGRY